MKALTTLLMRWGRFNVVGAMGMVVQLGVLAVCNRLMGGHYLWATAVAIEAALLHNFAWHVRWTWRGIARHGSRLGQMARFQLLNGAVSLLGNLVLMRVLVHGAGLPVVAANGVAIVCCSAVNFGLGRWVFEEGVMLRVSGSLRGGRPTLATMKPSRRWGTRI